MSHYTSPFANDVTPPEWLDPELVEIFHNERPDERIDLVKRIYDDSVYVITSQFIDLAPDLNEPHPHLQICRLWDWTTDEDGDFEYDQLDNAHYREVEIRLDSATRLNWYKDAQIPAEDPRTDFPRRVWPDMFIA